MKEVKQPYLLSYPLLRLFKEDIKEIAILFQENFDEFEFVIDKYELTDISEIDKLKIEKTNYLHLRHFRYYEEERRGESIDLELTKIDAKLRVSDNTEVYLLGIATQINTMLSKRKSAWAFLVSGKVGITFNFILITLFLIGWSFLPWKFSDHSIYSILLMILTFTPLVLSFIWVACAIFLMRNHTLIYLINSSARTNFFSRNKDQIILALTVGIFTALVTGVLTAYITSLIIHNNP